MGDRIPGRSWGKAELFPAGLVMYRDLGRSDIWGLMEATGYSKWNEELRRDHDRSPLSL